MKQGFQVLLFGGDINVYSVARAFHEAYGIRSLCYGKFASGPAYGSAIIDYRPCHTIEEPAVFLEKVKAVAAAFADQTILLIACGDAYVKNAADLQEQFPPNVIAPYVSGEQIAQLTHKEEFYKLCELHGLDYPATFVHHKETGHAFTLPFDAPFVVKPSDGVAYWAHPFPGNEKVFICRTRDKLHETLDKIYASGYPDSVIIQDFIPGDDSFMHVLTNYSDQNASVSLMCLGHVLLEEHTPHGIGNHAVIVTEKNEALCEKFRVFLEAIAYRGFSNFDIKYDARDGKYKVFEINCRQGRSNYYVTGAGHNIARYLVEDRIENHTLPLTVSKDESLWRVVPRSVMRHYIVPSYHGMLRRLMAQKAERNPLFYAADKKFMRRLRQVKNQLGHIKKYKTYYEKKR